MDTTIAEQLYCLANALKKHAMYDKQLLVQVLKLTKTCAKYSIVTNMLYQCPCTNRTFTVNYKKCSLTCNKCNTILYTHKCVDHYNIFNKHIKTKYCSHCYKYLCKECSIGHFHGSFSMND